MTQRRPYVLAVSPRFAPTNGADTHRLRLVVNHARSAGWDVEILCVEPGEDIGPTDPWLAEGLPPELPVHRVRPVQFNGWGLRGLAQRSIWPLYRRGSELLASGRFDLVFFSTTEFLVHLLGPAWKRRFGIPFCMDYQDPWVTDFYQRHPEVVPPGGRFKYAMAESVHRIAERVVAPASSGFLSVSKAYLEDLIVRYGESCAQRPRLIRPFPAGPKEMETVRAARARPTDLPAPQGARTWRYVGRGGPDMKLTASAFFTAWQHALDLGLLCEGDVRFEARGTSYAKAGFGDRTLAPLATDSRLEPRVHEEPDRLPYGAALGALVESDALVVFGSEEPAYTASKIYPYLLSGRPVLAIFHARSPVVPLIRTVGGATIVTFDDGTTTDQLAWAIVEHWFRSRGHERPVPLDRAGLAPFTAETQARELGAWFRDILNHEARPTAARLPPRSPSDRIVR